MRPPYDEKKTTQAAALLLKLNGQPIEYMKLVKLLYNIDREALRRWGRPITYDEVFSLPHGLILSITLDKAETSDPIEQTYWDKYIKTEGYYVSPKSDCSDGELSEAEVELITEWFEIYKDKSPFDMEKEHHDPTRFPEWQNPGESRIRISMTQILMASGYSESESEQITYEIKEDARLLAFIKS
jgi:hypothetical protein